MHINIQNVILIYCDCLLDKMIIEMKAFKIDCDIHYRNALITKLFINLYKRLIFLSLNKTAIEIISDTA